MRPVAMAILAVATLSGLLLTAHQMGYADLFTRPAELAASIRGLGHAGALVIVGMMATAVVLNPLPSAPVALASGAAYGHTWGTLYIVLGAQIGATIAFIVARLAGREVVSRFVGAGTFPHWVGTQNAMTLGVLLARLVPFVSFDLASYGAGLTPLKLWRFSLATFIGLLPASFLLAHFGSELTEADSGVIVGASLALGLVVLLPLAIGGWRRARRQNRNA